jgi:asparagine synthase (glutamine-hydrolysing)
MLHFDCKTLLPALLQVEDRMSMAHGIESRVPFLDPKIAEFAARIPLKIKFSNGKMKNILKTSFSAKIPNAIMKRTDKMGFTVPIKEWFAEDECKKFLLEVFSNGKEVGNEYMNYNAIIDSIYSGNSKFSRKIWGLLSLELWQQNAMSLFAKEQSRNVHD